MKAMFSKFAIGAALAMAMVGAQAAGVAGGIVVVGGIEVATGSVTGQAGSVSQGSAIAGTEVIGTGNSYQHTDSVAGGSASIGGTVGFNGANVVTGTTQYATINSNGNVSGNTPMVGQDGSIINGTTGFASSTNSAAGTATFQKVGIGGVAGIGGAAAITGF